MEQATDYGLSSRFSAATQLQSAHSYPANNAPINRETSEHSHLSIGAEISDPTKQAAQKIMEGPDRFEDVRSEKQLQDRLLVKQLATRDREVRAHEQAHVAVGGRFASGASYEFQRGPDGVNYAIAGEVQISTSKESTPQETLFKAQVVRRAALAPAEPSAQDYRVAAEASQMAVQARMELANLRDRELRDSEKLRDKGHQSEEGAAKSATVAQPSLHLYSESANTRSEHSNTGDTQIGYHNRVSTIQSSDLISETLTAKARAPKFIQSYSQISSFS